MALQVICSENVGEVPYIVVEDGVVLDVIHDFLQMFHLRGMAVETIRAYAYDLLDFWRFLDRHKLKLESLSQKNFADYILQNKNRYAPRTINRRMIVVRDFLNAQRDGYGDELLKRFSQPLFYKGRKCRALVGPARIKNDNKAARRSFSVKVPARILRPLKVFEIKKFLSCLRHYRDQLIVYLMLFCGLRTCEVLNLEIDDIDRIESKIIIRGKGEKQRVLPLCAAVQKTLYHYLNYERPEVAHNKVVTVLKGKLRGKPLTREGLRSLFRYWRRRVKLGKAHPHMLRHTFCSNLIAEGVSLPVVQKLMGHSSIEVTMMYVHMNIEDVTKEYYRAIQTLQDRHAERGEAY